MDTVLVVDNEPEITELIAMVLDNDRVAVHTAGDGLEALEIAREEQPRLVLTDVMMPHMDGVELCRRLRVDGSSREMVVLLMSAARRVDPGECGAIGLVRKPFDLRDVVETVHRHLGTSALPPG